MSAYSNTAKRLDAAFSRQTFQYRIFHSKKYTFKNTERSRSVAY